MEQTAEAPIRELSYGFLERRIGFLMRMASLADLAQLANIVDDKALTSLRMSMLVVIGANPGMQQVRLGEALRLSRSAATLAIDFWENRGCVERRPAPDDRRSYGVYITAEGERMIARFEEWTRRSDERILCKLDEAEAAQLQYLLTKMLG